MNDEEQPATVPEPVIFTIGHSNLALSALFSVLAAEGIEVVVDVRSQPVSRHRPHFNREPLAEALRAAGIRYSFMGDTLGGRPDNAAYYDPDGHVRYDRWAASPPFRSGLVRLKAAAGRYRLALLCAEADPAACHRHLLIARALRDDGWPGERIVHLGADGSHVSDAALPEQSSGTASADLPYFISEQWKLK